MATDRERDLANDLQNLSFDLLSGVKSEADVARDIRPWAELLDAPAPGGRGLRLLSADDVQQLPPLQWLVEGLLPAETLLAIFGVPSSGKSFLMLDLACSIATGRSWLGGKVAARASVLYVAAEGATGLSQRLAAWMHAHQCTAADLSLLRFAIEPVHLLEERACLELLKAAQTLDPWPTLIVFDTLARSLGSGDDVKDMGALIENADRIRRAMRAAILFAHHPNAGGDRPRGHSRLGGDFETIMELKSEEERRVLHCRKQKDGPEFAPIALDLVPTQSSCVMYRSREGLGDETSRAASLTEKYLASLRALSEIALDRGATSGEWETAAEARDVSRATYMRARKALLQQGYVSERERGNTHRYQLTDSGRHALSIKSHEQSQNGISGRSHRLSPLIGDDTGETRPTGDETAYLSDERIGMGSES